MAVEGVDIIATGVRFCGKGVRVLDTGTGAEGKSNCEKDWRMLGEEAAWKRLSSTIGVVGEEGLAMREFVESLANDRDWGSESAGVPARCVAAGLNSDKKSSLILGGSTTF